LNSAGKELTHQLQPLGGKLDPDEGHACGVLICVRMLSGLPA
jgi:hypothetical protein